MSSILRSEEMCLAQLFLQVNFIRLTLKIWSLVWRRLLLYIRAWWARSSSISRFERRRFCFSAKIRSRTPSLRWNGAKASLPRRRATEGRDPGHRQQRESWGSSSERNSSSGEWSRAAREADARGVAESRAAQQELSWADGTETRSPENSGSNFLFFNFFNFSRVFSKKLKILPLSGQVPSTQRLAKKKEYGYWTGPLISDQLKTIILYFSCFTRLWFAACIQKQFLLIRK